MNFTMEGQEYQISQITVAHVFAKKLKGGKAGKGRPSKFARSIVETITGPLAETGEQTTLPVIEAVSTPVEMTESSEVMPDEVMSSDTVENSPEGYILIGRV